MNYLILSLILITVIAGLVKDHSKIITYLIIAIFFVLTCFSYDNYDYLLYNRIYLIAGSGGNVSYEMLFTWLMTAANTIGLTYDGLRIVITVIELILIYSSIKKYAGDNSMAWSLFFVFPGWMTTTLIRHSLSLAIIAYGIKYLIDENEQTKLRDTIIYVITVIIASLIHSAYWVFIVLLLVKYIKPRSILISGIISAVIVQIFGYTNFLFRIYSLLPIRAYTIEKYMQNNYANIAGTIYQIIRQAMIILWAIYIHHIHLRFHEEASDYNQSASELLMNKLVSINYASIFFVGIMYYAASTARMNHAIILINCIASAVCIANMRKKTLIRFETKMLCFGVVLVLAILACTIESNVLFERVIKMIFETNDLINAFN